MTLYNNAGQTDGSPTPPRPAPAAYVPLVPARILDTRTGAGGINGPLGPGSTVEVQIAGRAGVPASGASAVILNATVVGPAGPHYLTIYPTGAGRPLASDLNRPAKIRPNLVVIRLGEGGRVNMFISASTSGPLRRGRVLHLVGSGPGVWRVHERSGRAAQECPSRHALVPQGVG